MQWIQGKTDSWYIYALMVNRKFQGQGIGKGLIGLVREKVSTTYQPLARVADFS